MQLFSKIACHWITSIGGYSLQVHHTHSQLANIDQLPPSAHSSSEPSPVSMPMIDAVEGQFPASDQQPWPVAPCHIPPSQGGPNHYPAGPAMANGPTSGPPMHHGLYAPGSSWFPSMPPPSATSYGHQSSKCKYCLSCFIILNWGILYQTAWKNWDWLSW